MAPSRERAAPVALVLTSVTSVQFGAALAATLFPLVGPVAVVALRSIASAVALAAVGRRGGAGGDGARSRPRPRDLRTPLALGVVLAGMNTCVYEAVERLPLGVVITLEFLGPLAVALAHSRRRGDVLPALAAAGGVALLAGPTSGGDVGLAGVLLALGGAVGWALYILLNRALGRQEGAGGLPGHHALTLATAVAAVLVTPFAVLGAGREMLQPRVLLVGIAVGALSSALPYSLDRLALRRLPAGVFGVLMSVNPAVATLAGVLVLHQRPGPPQLAGTALVVVASVAATRTPLQPAPVRSDIS